MIDKKDFVLTAFDTLFNKRDYEAAAKLWSPDYIQHSAHIPNIAPISRQVETGSSTS